MPQHRTNPPTLSHRRLVGVVIMILGATSLGQGCDVPETGDAPETARTAELPLRSVVLDGPQAIAAAMAPGTLTLVTDSGVGFRRVGLRFDADGDARLEYRAGYGATWSAWGPVEVSWSELPAHNATIVLDGDTRGATRLELRTGAGAASLKFLAAEIFEHFAVPEVVDESDEEPFENVFLAPSRFRTTSLGLAPPSFVNPRSAWGARATSTCGSAHTPSYLTIHHTVSPTVDSMSPEARLRQIQAYHIDTNGWCDIGYHFLVSADGRVWQGRASHDRSGAHVANHNTNNVGTSFMGSFHIDPVPQAMLDGAAPLLGWFRDNYGITLDRTHVLGHREWAGASTACPGDFLLSRVEELIALASPSPTAEVSVKVSWQTISGQARDLVAAGSSQGVFDAVEGQKLTGVLLVSNPATRPIAPEVTLGYWVEAPYLVPLAYTVQTDRPAKDQTTWVPSPFQDATNPPADAPPAEGFIRVGDMEPGESVRIVFTLSAAQYSFGAVDHPDLRGWVKHIANYYGEQDSWGDAVESNGAGGVLRAYSQLDVFSPLQWQFNGSAAADLEGWTMQNDVSDLALNLTDTALATKASGADPHIAGPPWTYVDTARFDRVVMRVRQHGAARTGQLFWAPEGAGFTATHQTAFTTAGAGAFEVLEIDLGAIPEWSGVVTGLRIDPWDGGPYTGAEAWFDIDYVMLVGADIPVEDADHDGFVNQVDCDDTNPLVYPGAAETCDGLDNNCDGVIDEEPGCAGADVRPTDDTDAGLPDASAPTDTRLPQPDTAGRADAGDAADSVALARVADACACQLVGTPPSGPSWSSLLAFVGLLGAGWWRRTRGRRGGKGERSRRRRMSRA